MTTKYLIDIPNLDPSKPWIVIKECDTKDKAISFTKKTWGAENGYLCLISHIEQCLPVELIEQREYLTKLCIN